MNTTNNVTISTPIGVRVTAALVVLGLVAEVLSDNIRCNDATPMTVEICVALCESQGDEVERVEAWACSCRAPK